MNANSEIFEKVRAATDIVEIVGECVALKRAGKEFKGLCPFHDDHKPSMAVVPQKQIFHCFVCGTGGDVFKFIKEYHKLTAGEALRMLAQRAGIKLPELPRTGRGGETTTEGQSVREQIAATNEWACTFFQKHLRSPQGKLGLDYLHSRGLTDETIDKFRLGYAPDSWTALTSAAMRLGTKADTLEQAGLIKKRQDGSPYDIFRGRVMFPIIDSTGGGGNNGRIVAFGGRVLQEKRDEAGIVVEAKYLNTPETRLFNKSESVYGINFARPQIVRSRTAVVVEGYMDVIACHQVGVTNVIATLGTALTAEHARILKNYAQTIVLTFDSDDAGARAADRAVEVFIRTPLDIKIQGVPDGKDPCDFCMKNGGDAFQKIIDTAPDAFTYKWNILRGKFGKSNSVSGRQESIVEFLRFTTASVESKGGLEAIDPIRRGQLIIKLSTIVGLPVDEVAQMLFRLSRLRPTSPQQHEQLPIAEFPAGSPFDALRDAERWLIGFIMNRPELYALVREEISLDLFTRETAKAELFLTYFENTNDEDRSPAGFCAFAAEMENTDPLIHAIISWERAAARWEDLTEFSDAIAKLIRMCRTDLGHTAEKVVIDCFQYLIDASETRMRLFDHNSLEEISLEQHFKEIENIKNRMVAGRSVNKVGYYDPLQSQRRQNFEYTRQELRRTAV